MKIKTVKKDNQYYLQLNNHTLMILTKKYDNNRYYYINDSFSNIYSTITEYKAFLSKKCLSGYFGSIIKDWINK